MEEFRVVIAGYFGKQNAGDEAILRGIMQQLNQAITNPHFIVISNDPEDTTRLHNVDSINWKDLPKSIMFHVVLKLLKMD